MSGMPDMETPVVNRLYAIYGQLMSRGIKRREKLEPVSAAGLNDFPMAYTLVGGLQAPVPANKAGSVTTTRLYIVRLLGRSLASATDTRRGAGNKAVVDLVPFINVFYSYFLTHPLLEVGQFGDADYQGPLEEDGAFIFQDITITDNGPGDIAGPGGIPHYALDFQLFVTMRAQVLGLG